jgi:hypothetical protein
MTDLARTTRYQQQGNAQKEIHTGNTGKDDAGVIGDGSRLGNIVERLVGILEREGEWDHGDEDQSDGQKHGQDG